LLAGAALPATALLAGTSSAQEQQPLQQPLGTEQQQGDVKDPLLAACLLIAARKQTEICTFALKRLQSDEAKAFARSELDEQDTTKAELRQIGFTYPVTAARGQVAQGASQPGTPGAYPNPTANGATGQPAGATTGTTNGVQPAGGQTGAISTTDHPAAWAVAVGAGPMPREAACLIALEHEICENCIRSAKKGMEQLTGAKLDRRFINAQLDAHMAARDKLQAFRRHCTSQMEPILADREKAVEKHIAMLTGILDKLDGGRAEGK